MKTVFSKELMQDTTGLFYWKDFELEVLKGRTEILLTDILESEIPVDRKFDIICKKLANREENQQITIGCAEIVLEIFDKKYPEDKQARQAIQAAKDYLNGHIGVEELREKSESAFARRLALVKDHNAFFSVYYAIGTSIATTSVVDPDIDNDKVASEAAYAVYTAFCAGCKAGDIGGVVRGEKNYEEILLNFLNDFINKTTQP